MNIKNYDFPPVGFVMKTDSALLNEAKARGFYDGSCKWCQFFSELFFNGGSIIYRQDVPQDVTSKIMTYLKAFMSSFEPKHEEKAAISALLLSEIAIHPDDQVKVA